MQYFFIAALLIAAALIYLGVHISGLAIVLVLAVIACIVATSVRSIVTQRQEANTTARQTEAQCQLFAEELKKLKALQQEFIAVAGDLSQMEQNFLWGYVVDIKVRACDHFAARDFIRAFAALHQAKEKASSLIAEQTRAVPIGTAE